jgi:hypothetical protein
MTRSQLAAFWRSCAKDWDACGNGFAELAARARETADELDKCETRGGLCATPAPVPVYDGDGAPYIGRACLNCGDE